MNRRQLLLGFLTGPWALWAKPGVAAIDPVATGDSHPEIPRCDGKPLGPGDSQPYGGYEAVGTLPSFRCDYGGGYRGPY